MRFSARVEVRLRPGIADPEGATVERALPALGFSDVHGVRAGRAWRFEVEADDEASATDRVAELAHRLLANPVIEDAEYRVVATPGGPDAPAPAVTGA
jgi:phosphoribosylformylglycinamidine synthase subunit PurS